MASDQGGAPFGNTNARKGRRWRHALEWALEHWSENEHERQTALDKLVKSERALRAIALKVVRAALYDEPVSTDDKEAVLRILGTKSVEWKFAVEEIANRLDGKPTQPIAGDDDMPPVQVLGVEFVRAPDAKG